MEREIYVVIEKDEDGYFVGEAPQLRGCYSQGRTIEELMQNMREAIALCLEEECESLEGLGEFVGVRTVRLDDRVAGG